MPRRRYDEDDFDDDYDDRPRRRKAGNAVPVALIAGVTAVVLLGCGGLAVGYFLFAREMSKPKPPPPAAPPAPVIVTTAPTDPPPAEALATVVTVRRVGVTDGRPRLEVLYRFDQPTGMFDQFDLVFELEGRTQLESGTARVPIRGAPAGETQTAQVERELGFVDLRSGRVKVWIEKRTTPARPADRVSNVFKL